MALAIDALLRPGDHAVLARQIYGKSRTYLEWAAARMGCEITVVDHVDAPTLDAQVRPNTRLVLAETYSNPLTRALDPDATSAAVLALRDRAPDLCFVIDDTIATPWGFKASLLDREGIHTVVGAGTKAVGGQDRDTLGYIASHDIGMMNRAMDLQAMRGGTLSWRAAGPFVEDLAKADALHATRCDNATVVAAHLAAHAGVAEVHHPSLASHPRRGRGRPGLRAPRIHGELSSRGPRPKTPPCICATSSP